MLPNIVLLFPLPSRSSYFKHVAVLVKWGTPQVQTCRQNCKHLWFIVQLRGKQAQKYQELILFNFLLCMTAEGEKKVIYNKDTLINYITRSQYISINEFHVNAMLHQILADPAAMSSNIIPTLCLCTVIRFEAQTPDVPNVIYIICFTGSCCVVLQRCFDLDADAQLTGHQLCSSPASSISSTFQ